MGTWTDGGSMLSVDMGVDIHLCFLFGGDLGVYSISIYIFLYTPCTIQHILYDSTFYSCFCSWLHKFAKFFSAGFRVGWRDAMNDSNVSALCLRPWKNIVVIHSRAFWRWRYLGLFSMHNPGGIWFKIVLQIQFWMSKGFDFFFGGDMIYSYPLHLCMVFIYIY